MFQLRPAILFSAIVGTACVLLLFQYRSQKAQKSFFELLLGSNNRHISLIEIESPKNRIIIRDPESLSYLTRMFRLAVRDSSGGAAYRLNVSFYDGGTVSCVVLIPSQRSSMTIHFPAGSWFEDGEYYVIPLRDPVPRPLLDIISELAPDDQK